ncbi:MAG: TolC family protein [Xanthomonadales bacterium]|nr:TolC family protein [Xanthomonadales bacterium]
MRPFFLLTKPVNRRPVFRTLFLLALLCFCGVVNAADSDAENHTLSLNEAIIKTIEHNPELRAFDYRLKAQQGRVEQAGIAPSPEIDFLLEDLLGSGDNRGVDSAQATLSISWVLERGLRQHYINAATAGSSLIKAQADIQQLNAAAETARRYLQSLAFQARELNADKSIHLAEEIIQSVSKRVKAGHTPAAELSRAQAELAHSKLQREDIVHELRAANHLLAAQWGETSPSFSRVEGDVLTIPQIASFENLKSRLPENPEFIRLLSSQLLKQAELDLALAQSKPSWRVSAGVRHSNVGNDQSLITGISIPFGKNTRNPGRIAEARANLAKTDNDKHAVQIQSETALLVIYEKLQHSLHVINAVQIDIIPPLEKALVGTRRAYQLGRYSYLELRSVQNELLDAHNMLLEASVAAHGYLIEIERLTGVSLSQTTTGNT